MEPNYSRCLGKNKDPNKGINHTSSIIKSITYEDFVHTVGAEKILEFQSLDNSEELNGDSKLLFNIFNLFKNTVDIHTIQTTETGVITDDIQDIITETHISSDLTLKPAGGNEIICNIQDIHVITEYNLLSDFLVELPENGDITYNLIDTIVTEDTMTLDIQSTSDNLPSVNQDNSLYKEIDTSIDKFLFWPKTPERKGKKQTEKLPFVLTSSDRQNAERRKIEEKEGQEKI
uniref:Uncharacterized protein LOC114336581 n=1 Tax=Diabrotica virgifera virgifera TaxID=50390 RepID=A0A6P7GFC7_DIAVI